MVSRITKQAITLFMVQCYEKMVVDGVNKIKVLSEFLNVQTLFSGFYFTRIPTNRDAESLKSLISIPLSLNLNRRGASKRSLLRFEFYYRKYSAMKFCE